MKYKIYKLILNGEVVYIGRTSQTLKRRKTQDYGDSTEILKEAHIELIEETNDVSRERYWIDHYLNNGFNLLNKRKGDGFDRKSYMKEYDKERRKTDKYKESEILRSKSNVRIDYFKSEKRKNYIKDYHKTDKYKEYQKNYKENKKLK